MEHADEDPTEERDVEAAPSGAKKKVVFLAGKPSHGAGEHEHRAGCMLLAEALNKQFGDKILATVYTGGWPEDVTGLDNADAIVSYTDGGGGHPLNFHSRQLDDLMKKGIGLGCVHYGVETTQGEKGQYFLDWIGGYFEPHWSVNPHWDADYTTLPTHEVTRGVKPFKSNDEWYYHMRFREGMKDVTPILTALPPKTTLTRPDGPHSGNPAVREAIEKGEPQHMMWVATRDGGNGRGFGVTGGHFHRNWQNEDFRKVVLNAIAWIAKVPVPEAGVPVVPLDDAAMTANLDEKGNRKKK